MRKLDIRKCLCETQPQGPTYYDGRFQIVCPNCGMTVEDNDAIDCCIEWNARVIKPRHNWWNKLGTVEPKIDEDVLLLYADGIINRATYIGNGRFTEYVDGYELGTKPPDVDFPVLYWMSTPEPPKGE